MLDINTIENFHFLRPLWLLSLPLVGVLYWKLRNIYNSAAVWKKAIAPHLLTHLMMDGGDSKSFRPYQLMAVALVFATFITAGPSWKKEITPFTQDRAPLIIALELTRSMMAVDQPPSRLERAKQKIRDILVARKGARTAIIVYAGSAHAALPLTDDAALIEIYLESLFPSLMPVQGNDATQALNLAQEMLWQEEATGTVLFMSDGIDQTHAEAFKRFKEKNSDQIIIMGFGSDQGGLLKDEYGTITDIKTTGANWTGLGSIANASGGKLIKSTLDDRDVHAASRLIKSHLVNALEEDKNLRWHDSGYYLVWLLMIMMLVWFRRGWTVI